MKTYKMTIETIDHKKKKHKCGLCGSEAVAKIKYTEKFLNLGSTFADKVYLCDDCASKIIGFNNDISFKELKILKLRLKGLTLEEIGKEYGITRERVRQILNKIYKKIEGENE